MASQAHNAYLESRILTADPVELVRVMYQAAIGEIRAARVHLQNKDIRSRTNAINKACAILTELTVSLDLKSGGEYAERLQELYGYMMHKLTQANFEQREEPMTEVCDLLTTLLEGWEEAQQQLQAAVRKPALAARAGSAAGSAWAQSQEDGYTPQSWSF